MREHVFEGESVAENIYPDEMYSAPQHRYVMSKGTEFQHMETMMHDQYGNDDARYGVHDHVETDAF